MKRVKEIKLLLVASLILMVFITPNVSAMSIDGFDAENELIIIDDSKNIVEIHWMKGFVLHHYPLLL